jgi:hypothetical protein
MTTRKLPLRRKTKSSRFRKSRLRRNRKADTGSRLAQDVFNNFYCSRRKVYWLNFIRGVFFGLGSLLGGTVIVALIIWLLSQFVDLPGGIGEFVKSVINSMQN